MNFEAVGPERLVLVARDPWIAAPCVIGARQMAINIVEYNLIRFLRENNIFRLGGDLLEVGEANWYGV